MNNFMTARTAFLLLFLALVPQAGDAQQGSGQDDTILERGDKLLEEAKLSYEEARSKNSIAAFVDAGFKLEEARIKFLVLQEIGLPDKQKLANDRMRAINQLSKLIHDGKVAISGSPADSPLPPPPDPGSPEPGVKPAEKPDSKPPVDVMQRLPIPDPAKQRDAEKLIRDLFKDLYAKKTPAERQALSRALIDQAVKTQGDPVAVWVLYREAQDIAVQTCDVRTAVEAIEAAAKLFDTDALSTKHASFLAAGKFAKSPAEFASLTDALLALVDELIASDQYDAADKATSAAIQHARRANDAALSARATTSVRETAEAKIKFQAMKSALETLAKTPDDPAANSQMGQFLCFVKGNWDLGLRFFIKGSDQTLKALAEKEVAFPAQPTERAALADSWYDLAEKEKSPLCKRQLFTHAKVVYESAVADSTGLVRAKIEKRLESLQSLGIFANQAVVDITTLTAKKATVGYFSLGVNNNMKNLPFMVQNKECRQYIFAHAPSSLIYDIPPKCKTFTATGAKLDKNAGFVTGTWKYIVIVDGKSVYESKPLNEIRGFEIEISVPLPAGAKEIELKVDECGDNACDWSVWAYPRFVR